MVPVSNKFRKKTDAWTDCDWPIPKYSVIGNAYYTLGAVEDQVEKLRHVFI